MVETRTVGCLAASGALLVAGTLGTGLLPPTLPYQALAGALIVAAFALVFLCMRETPTDASEN
jgi:hypothetical protein